MHKVSIKNETENSIMPTYVSIDGQPIRAVSVNFNQSIDVIPTCEVEINALPDIEALADILFRFTPQTTQETVKVLRHELITDKDLYNAFIASILGAIEDINKTPDGTMEDMELAKHIADRIIGEE